MMLFVTVKSINEFMVTGSGKKKKKQPLKVNISTASILFFLRQGCFLPKNGPFTFTKVKNYV